jgi:DNA polymerase V
MSVTILGRSTDFQFDPAKHLHIPLFVDSVSAGFPSPADDYVEQTLDLNELCIKHPAATFFVRVDGDSMIEAGIYPKDILVVDRSVRAVHGDIVVAAVGSEMTVKELQTQPTLRLVPRNSVYSPIDFHDGAELEIFGVVTNIIRNLKQSS